MEDERKSGSSLSFIICSLSLTVISRQDLIPTTSVIDKIEENAGDEPKIPENND